MTVTARAGYTNSAEPARISVADSDGVLFDVKGVESIALSGGEKESAQRRTLDGGSQSSVGSAGAKQVEISCSPPLASRAYRILLDAYTSNSDVTITIETAGVTQLDNAVSADTLTYAKAKSGNTPAGAITAAGGIKLDNAASWPIGIGISFGTGTAKKLLVLEHVTSATAGVGRIVDGTDANIAATADWERVAYGIKRTITCAVLNADNLSYEAGGDITDTLTLLATTTARDVAYVY